MDLIEFYFDCKRYEKGTALVAAYSPRLKRIGIQNWRRASTVAGMSRQAFDAQRGVAKGIAGRPASSTAEQDSAGADSVRSLSGRAAATRREAEAS